MGNAGFVLKPLIQRYYCSPLCCRLWVDLMSAYQFDSLPSMMSEHIVVFCAKVKYMDHCPDTISCWFFNPDMLLHWLVVHKFTLSNKSDRIMVCVTSEERALSLVFGPKPSPCIPNPHPKQGLRLLEKPHFFFAMKGCRLMHCCFQPRWHCDYRVSYFL